MLDLQQIDLEGKRRVERIKEQGQDSFISYGPSSPVNSKFSVSCLA